ncbi:membrane protease subunit [Mesorhizobium sp. Pch-S]|nr:membrane protease subunit [Mesorhizobium sp. Pch-S]
MSDGSMIFGGVMAVGVLVISSIGGCSYFYPKYNVYAQQLAGEAELKKAESNRRIRVLEAQAKLDGASLEAKAEVERAKGVAQANQIIADSLGGPEGYLRWRYIEMLQETGTNGRDVIYVPTEANLPILEAGKTPGAK